MILCMTGTGPYNFDRVTKKLDQLAKKNDWEVFIQIGHANYIPENCKYETFMGRDLLQKLIEQCELVVCHGGFGSIRDSLAYNKPVIAVPRIAELNEVQDDHQEIMVKELEKAGHILAVYDVDDLESMISRARDFNIKKIQNSEIPSIINNYINS
ncbi:MAG: hypothetical protein KAT90_00065 [Gammaproteobacteria bacterium]|nr:hypothetical protein [Gammaproteobacteria bacterium]